MALINKLMDTKQLSTLSNTREDSSDGKLAKSLTLPRSTSRLNTFHNLSTIDAPNVLIPIHQDQQNSATGAGGEVKQPSLTRFHSSDQLLTKPFKLKPLTTSKRTNQFTILNRCTSSSRSYVMAANIQAQLKMQQKRQLQQQIEIGNPVGGFRPSIIFKKETKFQKIPQTEQKTFAELFTPSRLAGLEARLASAKNTVEAEQLVDGTNDSFLSRKSNDNLPNLNSLRSSIHKFEPYLKDSNLNLNFAQTSINENEPLMTTRSMSKTKFLTLDDFVNTNRDENTTNITDEEFLTFIRQYRKTKELDVVADPKSYVSIQTSDEPLPPPAATEQQQNIEHVVAKVKSYTFNVDHGPNFYKYDYLDTGENVLPLETFMDQYDKNRQLALTNEQHLTIAEQRPKSGFMARKAKEQYPSFFINYINNKYEARNYSKFVTKLKENELTKKKPKIIYPKTTSGAAVIINIGATTNVS